MKYNYYIIKRKIENIFIFPFIVTGSVIAKFKPLKKSYKIYFFFPFYHTGGAEKVHALIAQVAGNEDCIIFFTKKSTDSAFLKDFEKSNCVIKNISCYTDNKWLYCLNFIYRGIITGYINHETQAPILFNGQCNFAYKISPWIKNNFKQVELIHSFNSFSWIRIPFIPFIHQTIMISKVRIENHLRQYKKLGVPEKFNENITYISNGIYLPTLTSKKDCTANLNILYVGRGTPEKRVYLVAEIAKNIQEKFERISFTLAGDVANAIPESLKQYCNLKGNITDENELAKLYKAAHILLITSDTEGFPVVVMEAMAYGCAIIATPVGDLPVHIKNSTNGFILSGFNNEKLVVDEMYNFIVQLNNNRDLLATISEQNMLYAKNNFDIEVFKKQYISILQ
ncbi:MAG: hypothetical protein AMXMBFR79_13380 [Chitinophagaceae bacterium]|mgnify:FL=1|nr:glycosyltransferase family 4 protein [Chitinophagales bacterium]